MMTTTIFLRCLKPKAMNLRIISYYIGISLLLVASLMAISAIVAVLSPGDESLVPLLYSAAVTALAGCFPLIFVSKKAERLNFKEGNVIVVGSWCFACLFGMIPYLMYGGQFSFINALFESVSGFTTTGASILNDIDSLPKGLQFWRISTAWAGGIGIVTLFTSIMSRSFNRNLLSAAEISQMALQPFDGERKRFFANRMLVTYLALTLLTIFALRLTGMPWFDSVTNAMSACSTCGFCNHDASIAFYGSNAAEIVLTFAMLASGLNFGLLFLSFVRGSNRNLLNSEATRIFLILICIAIAIICTDLVLEGGYGSAWTALKDAAFQVVSIATTTGFATKDTNLWPAMSVAVLIICSLVCGCSGSTSGGIKIDRVLLAMKGIGIKVGSALSPRLVQVVRIDGEIRPYSQVSDAFGYIFCYLVIIVAAAAVNIAFGLDLTTGITASIACIGNVGPGFGEVGSMANYASFPVVLKFTCLLEMLIGRLEIFPVLYLMRTRGLFITS